MDNPEKLATFGYTRHKTQGEDKPDKKHNTEN